MYSYQINEHLLSESNVGVDVLAGYELGIPGDGFVETRQLLVANILLIMFYQMVD